MSEASQNMRWSDLPPVWLVGLAHALPERVVTSDEVIAMVRRADPTWKISSAALTRLSGVRERRYADSSTCSSDLAAQAGRAVLDRYGCPASDVDVLIFASATQDVAEPATSNRVQELTGCTSARVFDVKNACNSFVDALDVAASLIQTNRARTVLVTAGEVISGCISYRRLEGVEPSAMIAGLTLGDAGAAALLTATDELGAVARIGPATFLSCGENWQLSRVMAGGTIRREDFTDRYFISESAKLFDLAVDLIPQIVRSTLDSVGWSAEGIQLAVPHQVSLSLTDRLCRETGIPHESAVRTGRDYGNTAAASIPLALSRELEDRGFLPERTLLVGGAAGFSAACMALSGIVP